MQFLFMGRQLNITNHYHIMEIIGFKTTSTAAAIFNAMLNAQLEPRFVHNTKY